MNPLAAHILATWGQPTTERDPIAHAFGLGREQTAREIAQWIDADLTAAVEIDGTKNIDA